MSTRGEKEQPLRCCPYQGKSNRSMSNDFIFSSASPTRVLSYSTVFLKLYLCLIKLDWNPKIYLQFNNIKWSKVCLAHIIYNIYILVLVLRFRYFDQYRIRLNRSDTTKYKMFKKNQSNIDLNFQYNILKLLAINVLWIYDYNLYCIQIKYSYKKTVIFITVILKWCH